MYTLTYFSNDVKKVIIKIITNSLTQESKLTLLNPTNNLLTIRQKLQEDYNINNTLLFLRKFSENYNYDESYGFAEIASKDEENIRLDEIMDKNILYMKCIKINVDWNTLNNLRKLD